MNYLCNTPYGLKRTCRQRVSYLIGERNFQVRFHSAGCDSDLKALKLSQNSEKTFLSLKYIILFINDSEGFSNCVVILPACLADTYLFTNNFTSGFDKKNSLVNTEEYTKEYLEMENYRKGKNVEEKMERSKIPISSLPKEFLWMQVTGGSKIRNLLDYALKNFGQLKVIVWSGSGPSVGKTITCVEIMKREYKQQLHQINKICYTNVDEYWDPESLDLNQLVVKRKLPVIHICLSLEKLTDNQLGYQAPSDVIPFRGQNVQKPTGNGRNFGRSNTFQRGTNNKIR